MQTLLHSNIQPNLYIIDYYIPGCHAPDLIAQVMEVQPASNIMVVSSSINPTDHKLAIDAGAKLFMNKSSEPSQLLEAVMSLLAGQIPDTPDVIKSDLSEKFNLTPRQLEILSLVAKGFSNKEIARLLDVSPETVKSHLRDIFQRFGVANRIEAIDFARSNGLT